MDRGDVKAPVAVLERNGYGWGVSRCPSGQLLHQLSQHCSWPRIRPADKFTSVGQAAFTFFSTASPSPRRTSSREAASVRARLHHPASSARVWVWLCAWAIGHAGFGIGAALTRPPVMIHPTSSG